VSENGIVMQQIENNSAEQALPGDFCQKDRLQNAGKLP
jgi:hypothetical protein